MSPYLTIAINAAREAGKLISRAYPHINDLQVKAKNFNDFVTEVDYQAEQIIINTIKKAYPKHSILAEESGHSEGNEFNWIIDPLDGTTNFLHGYPVFAISIALQIKNKTEIAVIYDTERDELYTATRGGGAQLNNRRLRVSNRVALKGALLGTGFPIRQHEYLEPYLEMFTLFFSKETAGIRRAGSAAIDLAYLAAGRIDGFWELSLKPWDIAAGILLIQEAGGIVSGLTDDDPLTTGHILAAPLKIHLEMSHALSSIIKTHTSILTRKNPY